MEGSQGLRFAANISDGFLFSEVNFLQRFKAAKDSGFSGVECAFPASVTLDSLASAQKAAGIQHVHLNLPAGDWAAGERGIAANPAKVKEFQESVETGVKYANALGCKRVHALAGVVSEACDKEQWTRTFVENLKWAADQLSKEGILLLIEPISTIPGYFLQHQEQALDILHKVGHSNLKLQFDIYHAQRMDGNLCDFMSKNIHSIGHIQIGQVPGRHEPDQSGELNYSHLFSHIKSLGYDGWVGCEYKPAGDTTLGLKWLPKLQ
ncbi:hydroxypyruvate isomerase-like [Sycon ciliatum]|uniref:hydroxypyruvate isomerase-like n=1 Tax=Sycon ciliatum TaxID=27933 RepID=UPI0031F6013D